MLSGGTLFRRRPQLDRGLKDSGGRAADFRESADYTILYYTKLC